MIKESVGYSENKLLENSLKMTQPLSLDKSMNIRPKEVIQNIVDKIDLSCSLYIILPP